MPFVNRCGGQSVSLQSKTVTPSTAQQVVTPDSDYDGLDKVTVDEAGLCVHGTYTCPVGDEDTATSNTGSATFTLEGSNPLPDKYPKRIFMMTRLAALNIYIGYPGRTKTDEPDGWYNHSMLALIADRNATDNNYATTFIGQHVQYISGNRNYGAYSADSNYFTYTYNKNARTLTISTEDINNSSGVDLIPTFYDINGSQRWITALNFGFSYNSTNFQMVYEIMCEW